MDIKATVVELPNRPVTELPRVSVVVPVYNERGTLDRMHQEVTEILETVASEHEIIFIDDGSTDGSTDVLDRLAAMDSRVRVYSFRSNRGKAEALNVGFKAAVGDIIITMDADLQDVPAELPRFLDALDDGYDLVSGWKQTRHDPLGKTLPSKFFNYVTARVSGVKLHDFNCGYKAYRREVVQELDLYGEMHRFVPVLAAWQGFRVREIPVEHAPRTWGESKYGFSRLFKGAYDLLTVYLLTRFENRPMHFFGTIGVGLAALGFVFLLYMSYLRLALDQVIGNRPLLFLGMLMMIAGIQFFSLGLVGEILVRRTRGRTAPLPLRVRSDEQGRTADLKAE